MAIDPNQIDQFNEDGSLALSQIGLNFACRHCHVEGGSASPKIDSELIEAATGIHTPKGPEFITSQVFIDGVTVEEQDGQFVAIVEGNLPDTCSTIDSIDQELSGNTVSVVINCVKPTDEVCGQALTPFTETIILETVGLESGEYSVEINGGQATATFTIS